MVNAFDARNETIHAWLVRYMRTRTDIDALRWIGEQVRLDKTDGYAYTMAPEMDEVRKAYAEQLRHLEREQ